jgi:hypothetical protein
MALAAATPDTGLFYRAGLACPLIPFPNQPITLSASLAVQPNCPCFAFAYSADLKME